VNTGGQNETFVLRSRRSVFFPFADFSLQNSPSTGTVGGRFLNGQAFPFDTPLTVNILTNPTPHFLSTLPNIPANHPKNPAVPLFFPSSGRINTISPLTKRGAAG
jgi:hypothetical protein